MKTTNKKTTHPDALSQVCNLEKFLTNNGISFCVEHSASDYGSKNVYYHLTRGDKTVMVRVSNHLHSPVAVHLIYGQPWDIGFRQIFKAFFAD